MYWDRQLKRRKNLKTIVFGVLFYIISSILFYIIPNPAQLSAKAGAFSGTEGFMGIPKILVSVLLTAVGLIPGFFKAMSLVFMAFGFWRLVIDYFRGVG